MTSLVSIFVTTSISMIEHICVYDSMVLGPIVKRKIKIRIAQPDYTFFKYETRQRRGALTWTVEIIEQIDYPHNHLIDDHFPIYYLYRPVSKQNVFLLKIFTSNIFMELKLTDITDTGITPSRNKT